ncbi:hypothetical protein, partial [Kingella kingae]|uniref:hypothetical protein n=1 Tax=Kingella kingae TaxID=504 RepID=UPI0025533FA0
MALLPRLLNVTLPLLTRFPFSWNYSDLNLEPVFTNNYLINFNVCEIYPSLTKFSADKFVCS